MNKDQQRPLMDPLFVKPFTPPVKKSSTNWLVPSLRWFGKTMVSRPLAVRRAEEAVERRSPFAEFVRALICQLLFLPLALAAAVFSLVYLGTHPPIPSITADPNSVGVYFDPVTFNSTDGATLSAWMAPALDARRIIDQRDLVLSTNCPAVILVHDFGNSPQEMLPLIPSLHEEGVTVLTLGLRGVGAGLPRGQTFGINEAGDIRAAVDWLRTQPRVDVNRIAVVGLGTGATAALLAAAKEPSIKALVLADPVESADGMIAKHIGPHDERVKWLQPACKWIFELYYHVEADDVNYSRMNQVMASRPTLMLPGGSNRPEYLDKNIQTQVLTFVRQQFHTRDTASAVAQ